MPEHVFAITRIHHLPAMSFFKQSTLNRYQDFPYGQKFKNFSPPDFRGFPALVVRSGALDPAALSR
jgi:hypothetical protein